MAASASIIHKRKNMLNMAPKVIRAKSFYLLRAYVFGALVARISNYGKHNEGKHQSVKCGHSVLFLSRVSSTLIRVISSKVVPGGQWYSTGLPFVHLDLSSSKIRLVLASTRFSIISSPSV